MLATDELELAFPGPGAPAFGDGPSLCRILAAVRAPGEAAEALAVAARVCRTIGGVLCPVHVRTCDRPVRRAGRFCPETADIAAVLDGARLAVWACGGSQPIPECSIRANRDSQGGDHARAESHYHGRGGAGTGGGRDRSRRGHRQRASG
jgi:hypothetical protein